MKDKEKLNNLEHIKEDLEKSQAFLNSLIDQNPFPTVITDLNGTAIRTNQALRDILNLSDEQLIGKYNVFKDPQIPSDVIDKLHDVLEKGIPFDFSFLWSAKDTKDAKLKGGNAANCEGTTFPIKDQNGTITNAVIIYKDVTERLHTEKALKESDEQYRLFADNIQDNLWIMDLEGNVLYSSPSVETMTGFTPEETMARSLNESLTPESCKKAMEFIAEELENDSLPGVDPDRSRTVELEEYKKDGSSVWTETSASFLRDENGSPINILGITRDITERKQSFDQLQTERVFSDTTIKSLPGLFYVFEKESALFFRRNKNWAKITGYSEDEIDKMTALDFFKEGPDRDLCVERMQEVYTDGSSSMENRLLTKDGRQIPYYFSGELLTIEGETYLIGMGMDITDRIMAEEHLKESEEQFKQLSEATWEAIVLHEDGVVLEANSQYFEMFGYDRAEVIGKEFISKTTTPESLKIVRKQVAESNKGPYLATGKRKDGSEFPMEIRVRMMSYRGHEVRVVAIRDITVQEESKKQIIREEKRYFAFLDNLDSGVIAHGPDTSVMFCNNKALQLLGLTIDQMLGKTAMDPYWKFLNADGTDMKLEDYPVNKTIKSMTKLEHYVLGVISGNENDIIWVLCNSLPVLDDSGELDHVLISFVDITEQKKAENEIRENEEKFRSLFDSMDNGCAVYKTVNGDDFVLADYNQAAEKMDNLEKSDLIGRNVAELFPDPAMKLSISKLFRKVWETGEPVSLPLSCYEIEGRDVWRRNYTYKLATGEIVVVFTDETERKKAEEREEILNKQLVRSERMEALGVLAGGVAHDLNNVLGPMVVLPDLIDEDLKTLLDGDLNFKGEIDESLSVIKSCAGRAAIVVRDLVALSRGGDYDRTATDINSLPFINGKDATSSNIKQSRPKITIRHKTSKDELMVKASVNHLDRVVQNLLMNAAEAIPEKGNISVTTSQRVLSKDYKGYVVIPSGTYAVIEVSDSGTGIAKTHLDRIFEPFFTKKKKNEHSGSGLGLSVVHGVVKDHDGFIDIETEHGSGTTFSIYLPIISDYDVEIQIDEDEDAPRGTERILVVDDEPGQRYLAKKSISKLGYTVDEAADGHEALKLFEQAKKDKQESPFDLVILDMIMEDGFDGLDTLNEILKEYPKQKVLIASGHAENDRSKATQELGAGWISKPYQLKALAIAVRTQLDG